MQINQGRFDVLVTEQFLNGSNVRPRLQQMSGKGVLQDELLVFGFLVLGLETVLF